MPSPEWHGAVLAERIAAVRDGRSRFVNWDEAKERLKARAPTFGLMPARSHSPKYGATLKTMDMPSFSRNDVILFAYPFSDRSGPGAAPGVVL